MRVNINLASQKYEDVRNFFLRWGAALAILAALAGILGGLAYLKHSRMVRAAEQTRSLQNRIAALQDKRTKALMVDNLPENREVTEQKRYWNTQLSRRSFSWTQLINDLQKIMPNRAYLNSVQPELTADNRLKLKLVITGEKPENARELQQRMETSNRFRGPWIASETPEGGKAGIPPTYRFEIDSDYIPPETIPSQSPPPASGSKKGA
jgi:type IV pilus assembly protein PilN